GAIVAQGECPPQTGAQLKQRVLQTVRGWHAPIEEMVQATDDAVIAAHDLFDRAVLKTWSKGRVTLLGDSAHLMSPFMGHGGVMGRFMSPEKMYGEAFGYEP